MPKFKVYDLNSSNALYIFCGEFLTPQEAVVAAYHYNHADEITIPLIDYVKSNLSKVTKGNSSVMKGVYYNYNDYCTLVKNT
jgi:hypothetical protein